MVVWCVCWLVFCVDAWHGLGCGFVCLLFSCCLVMGIGWVVGLVMFGVDLCRLVWFCLGVGCCRCWLNVGAGVNLL